MGEALVIDKFIGGFDAFREHLDSHIFSGEISPIDGVFYSGVSARIPRSVSSNIKENLEGIFGNVTINFQFMRISQDGIHAPHQSHNDASMGQYTCLIYLNRHEHCEGGTSFVSHITEGMPDGPETEDHVNIWAADNSIPEKWVIEDMISMGQNRAVIFPAHKMHRSEPVGGFGKTTKDARLVLVTFFNVDS